MLFKKIAAGLLAGALAMPFAAPAAAYDEVCVRQVGTYTSDLYVRKTSEAARDNNSYFLGEWKANFPHGVAVHQVKCMDTRGIMRPGDLFRVDLDPWHGPNPECFRGDCPHGDWSRCDHVMRWPEGGGMLNIFAEGTSGHPTCVVWQARMWEGCPLEAEGGFARPGCHQWRPVAGPNSAFEEVLQERDPAYLRSVLADGANPDAQPYGDETPLHAAIRLWRPEYIQLLRAKGAKAMIRDRSGRAAIRAAFDEHRDRPDFMQVLGMLMIPESRKGGRAGEFYQRARGVLNAKLINEGLAHRGIHGVIEVVRSGRADILQFALANGGDARAATRSRYSALHHAAARSLRMTRMLLEGGADPNLKTSDGDGYGSPLHWAVHTTGWARSFPRTDGSPGEIAAALLEAGADPNLPAHRGETPLHYAAQRGDVRAIGVMLGHGGDPNFGDHRSSTALHHAAYHGHLEAVEIMLRRGGDAGLLNIDGNTPGAIAEARGHEEVAAALARQGARQ